MTKNPLYNALAAGAYITVVGLFMSWGTRIAPKGPSFFAPIAVMALFTLSAAVMGYIFCYTPGVLYFSGKKKQGVELFLQTVGIFAILTFLALFLLFTGVFR